jgi:hypothetical protein
MQEMGGRKFCRGHCARSVKKTGKITFLRCRLRSSTPACKWAAIVKEEADGSAQLLQLPSEHQKHNESSQLQGKQGFEDLAERQQLDSLLRQTATARPQRALRLARLAKGKHVVVKAQLKQVQRLRKQIVKSNFAVRKIGELREKVAQHSQIPARTDNGYFCYTSIKEGSGKNAKPIVTVVATTRILQERWASGTECTVGVDGGFKFNLLGWPLHVLGQTNPAGNYGLCGLALTSTMEKAHIKDMIQGFSDSTHNLTKRSPKKKYGMSDAEYAYRFALSEVLVQDNLMCYFHVKQAARDNFMKRFPGNQEQKDAKWGIVSADIDIIRAAQSEADFQSRCSAIQEKWNQGGLDQESKWMAKDGTEHNYVSYFFKQWSEDVPEWYLGASGLVPAPGTNNGSEACVKNVRFDAGQVIGGIGETLVFMLEQMKTVSCNKFDVHAQRHVEDALWMRAESFRGLFGSPAIQSVKHACQDFYCCNARQDPDSKDVCKRQPISMQHARSLVRAFAAAKEGAHTTAEELSSFNGAAGARVFGVLGDKGFCSCPAFPPAKRCFHTLGLQLHIGHVTLPERLASTPLSLAVRGGNKPKAPGRGSVPLLADEKDAKIAQPEALLRKAKAGQKESQVRKPALQNASKAPMPSPPSVKPLRRINSKQTLDPGMLNAKAAGSGASKAPAELVEASAPGAAEAGEAFKASAELPEASAPEIAETAEQQEARELSNAIADVQSQIVMEGDPSIGNATCEKPVHEPLLSEGSLLMVPASGLCLAHCCTAAAAPEEWRSVHRRESGMPYDSADVRKELKSATVFLVTKMQATGISSERLADLLHGEYAEAEDLPYYAAAVGGSIGVEAPDGETHLQEMRYYGTGQLKMMVKLYYLSGKSQPHYKLLQSWMPV